MNSMEGMVGKEFQSRCRIIRCSTYRHKCGKSGRCAATILVTDISTSNDINLSYYIPTYVIITVETVTCVGDHQHGDGHI